MIITKSNTVEDYTINIEIAQNMCPRGY